MLRPPLRCASIALALAGGVAAARRQENPCAWGGDVNPGAGPRLVESVRRELRSFVRLPPQVRAKRAAELAAKRAVAAIEGWKRFRDPELRELALACLEHPDWHVVHRGLLCTPALREPSLFARAWKLLDHAEPRLREMAALPCLQVAAGPEPAGGGSPETAAVKQELSARFASEPDLHVRQALLALKRRLEGALEPRRLSEEIVVALDDGLRLAPFVRGLEQLSEVAPGATAREWSDVGRRSAAELPAATRFVAPLLRWGREEVPHIVLQPFGKERRKGEIVHTGQDVGGCVDGAGFYAIADGVVRLLTTGTDMGGGIVVEHRRGEEELVNAVYMYGAGTVFVEAGEEVACGQLLGTMGLSFSVENGGQFAHLHFGLYPGPFRVGHNYGYRPAAEGLDDWLDPAECLPKWIAVEGGAAK
jgi:murein DD-endopeptidase MepM/ murein hydrolase activator NlpD